MQCRLNHSGKNKTRVEHFATFEKLVFAVTSRVLRILIEHIDKFCSLESKLISIQGCWGNPDDGNCLKTRPDYPNRPDYPDRPDYPNQGKN